jgi:hypothetical protein
MHHQPISSHSCASRAFACPPNGLPISRRERTTQTSQNAFDLAREAVGCMGMFGGNLVDAVIVRSLLSGSA